jgi:hypothetical protein
MSGSHMASGVGAFFDRGPALYINLVGNPLAATLAAMRRHLVSPPSSATYR